jgi:predicted DNA-binding protein with PD1-like motif
LRRRSSQVDEYVLVPVFVFVFVLAFETASWTQGRHSYRFPDVILAESTRGRRLIGRLDRGVDILEGLLEGCRKLNIHAAEVRAFGALEEALLGEHDQSAKVLRTPRRFVAPLEILQLSGSLCQLDGRLHLQAHATLSRERDNGIEVLGGRLLGGRVFGVEFVVETFDDVSLVRERDARTGLVRWGGAASSLSAAVPSSSPSVWQDVAAASAQRLKGEETAVAAATLEVVIRAGDFIEHPQFGRCRVERVEGDQEFISARMANQRLIRLSLEVLQLIPAGSEGEGQVFRVVPVR